MKKIVLLILCCFMVLAAFAQAPVLKFNDGKFKIMQLTDLHWVVSDSYAAGNDSTLTLIREMIHVERPDLVMLTGDVVTSWNARKGWSRLCELFQVEKTPFAVTLGNHDEETDMTRDEIIEYLQQYSYNLTYDALPELTGAGNCALPVMSSDGNSEKWMLYLFDSQNNTQDRTFGYYDWIKFNQIEWYRNLSDETTKRNRRVLPSLAFFHIPFIEFETARWTCPEFGNKKEGVCAPNLNSGLFSSFVEKKDVIGVFVGHDHNNDYIVDFDGNIALAYGRKTGYNKAYDEKLSRGVRIINLTENDACFESYIRDLKGVTDRYVFEQKNAASNIPQFSGSFIQEFLVCDWDDARWNQEMQMLKEAGMKYLIYAPSLLEDEKGKLTSTYPSLLTKKKNQNRTLEKCLRSAQANDIKVFVGLNFNDRWWKVNYDEVWLSNQMELGNKVADELLALYKEKYPDAMYGWYWVWEVANVDGLTEEHQTTLANALNINLDHLTKVAPDMPFLLSPYMNRKLGLNADEYSKMWQNVFAKTHFRWGDIFSPQDCVGAGGLELNLVSDWFSALKRAVKSKPGLKYWANVETFDQRYWVSAPLERVKKQLANVNGYVGNIICFAYSHYNSPAEVNVDFHHAYCEYRKTGKLPDVDTPKQVSSVSVRKVAKGMEIKWTVNDMKHVDGYCIYRDGEVIRKMQIRHGQLPKSFIDKDGNANCIYEVSVYNVLGKESAKVKQY